MKNQEYVARYGYSKRETSSISDAWSDKCNRKKQWRDLTDYQQRGLCNGSRFDNMPQLEMLRKYMRRNLPE
jgi:hypothetical protein